MRNDKTIRELLAKYMEAAAGTGTLDPKQNNKNADNLHACYKELRDKEEGRAGIIGLVSDDNPHVRGWAAAHSLQWVPEIARPRAVQISSVSTRCACTVFSHGDQAKIVNRPSWDATSATESC